MNDKLKLGDGWQWKSDAHRTRFYAWLALVATAMVAWPIYVTNSAAIVPAVTSTAPWLALFVVGILIVRYRGSLRLARRTGKPASYRTPAVDYSKYKKVKP